MASDLRPTGQTGSGADAGRPAAAPSVFPEALRDLHRALHKTSVYPIGHPEVRAAIEKAARRLSAALEGRSAAVVGVAGDHLVIDELPLRDGPPALRSLAEFLHEMDVAALEFLPEVSSEDLERFLLELKEARWGGTRGKALALSLAEKNIANPRIVPIEYSGLSFVSQGETGESTGTGSGDVWEDLITTLTRPGAAGSAADPLLLAEEADRKMAENEGLGAGLLRQHVRSLVRRIGSMEPWQQDTIRGRLAQFVTSLRPELRQDLLRLDPGDPTDSLLLLADLQDVLPDSVLVDVLRDASEGGERLHGQFVGLMSKLAPSREETLPSGPESKDILGRWGLPEHHPKPGAAMLREALKEVIRRRTHRDFNPDEYRDLLDDLSNRELTRAASVIGDRFRSFEDPIEVRTQAVGIAVSLLGQPDAPDTCPEVLGYLGAAVDLLLDAGRLRPVRDAVVAVRSLCARQGFPDAAQRAATGFLRDFREPARIARILRLLRRDEALIHEAEPLLALGGVAALDQILDMLESDLEPKVASALRSAAVGMGYKPMSHVIETRGGISWARLRPAFTLIRLFPTEDALALLKPLATHPESRVRGETLIQLYELDRTPGAAEQYLLRGLGDADSVVVSLALRRLATTESPESTEILGRYIEGAIPGVEPSPEFVRRAARVLVARGPAGEARLCSSLLTLRKGVHLRALRRGAQIARELQARLEVPQVAAAVSRWRRSLAGFVFRLLSLKRSRNQDEQDPT